MGGFPKYLFDFETWNLQSFYYAARAERAPKLEYRKPWESSYDPKYKDRKATPASKLPRESSLPPRKYVLLRTERLPEDFISIEESVIPWLVEMKIKPRQRFTVESKEGKVATAFIFKSERAALLFKLAWG